MPALLASAAERPCLLSLILTHIFRKAPAMRREKVEILLIPAIRDGLQGSFAKSNCVGKNQGFSRG
jgi:hypothetical protein